LSEFHPDELLTTIFLVSTSREITCFVSFLY
jgi:hypothetical protein